ncbi:MAG TPA: hypothetical protein DCX01_00225 [Bacteroidetes bacterium]|nr:hypothetical protein [Bacteroidota bacterium]
MSKHVYLVIAFIGFLSTSIAQIPELNVLKSKASQSATGIEKARQFYNSGDYIVAEAMLYSELEKGNFTPNDFLLFANTLNIDDKPALAKEFYKVYAKESNRLTISEQIDQVLSSNVSYPANPVITNYQVSNPTVFRDKLYTELNGLMMMYDQDCDGNLKNRTEVLQGITDIPFGSISYFDNGNKAVASFISRARNTSSLYLLNKSKGKWKKPSKIFEGNANYAFPHMDVATNTLYFSSDKEGGYGGYDVYISNFNGASFDNPVNMGDHLNSAGNEINPTITEDWLYVSSNGHVSKGGYDLYKYKNLGDFNIIFLNCIELNTQQNELSLIPLSRTKFLITREVNGENKLLSVDKPKVVSSLFGNVIDQKGSGIANAYIIMNADEGMGIFAVTDVNGNFIYKSDKNIAEFEGIVMADGYESSSFKTALDQNLSVQLTKIKPIEILKVLERQTQAQSTSESLSNGVDNISVKSTKREVIVSEFSEERQPSSSRPDRGLYYIIIGSSYSYAQAYDFWTRWLPSFNGAEILEYDNDLYRIAFYAGSSEEQAMQTFNESRLKKKDIWILRPKN